VSRHRPPGRRRAPGRVKRLPDSLSRRGAAALAAKSVAGFGVVGGAAVALSLPLEASAEAATPAPASLSLASSVDLAERAQADRAARSATRELPAAVKAPGEVAPAKTETVGVTGVKAVAKPKPKPKPEPKATADPKPKSSSSSSSSPSSSSSSGSSNSYTGGVTARCASIGLIPNAQRLCSAVQGNFGLSNIGGYRPNGGEHSTGQAIDFMISSQAQGDAIAAWVQSNSGAYNVQYVIWRQRYWQPGSSWRMMADRGSATANHYDHVHVTVAY
jgi:hypothetical protein